MVDKEIVVSGRDESLGGNIPGPSETFTNKIIHPKNIALEARRDNARMLSGRQLRAYVKQARALDMALNEAGYYELLSEGKLLARRFETYQLEYVGNPDEPPLEREQKEDIERRLAAVSERLAVVYADLRPLRSMAQQHKTIKELIQDHHMAVERQRLHNSLTKGLSKEALKFAEIIIERWAQLGQKHEYMIGNKRRVDKVQFAACEVTPDAIFLKISVSRKAYFGFKSTLPNGVRVLDLIKDETLQELSFACQRQVMARHTFTNGAWIKVNRIGTTDGLLDYVTLNQVLNNYPTADKALLPIGFGVEEGRVISWVHLAKHPHFLIGGTTGAGKSNIINVIICSLLLKHSPQEVRFCLIDLKEGLEFQDFENVPHLLRPVVKEVEEAEAVLRQLEAERKRRALDLARAGVRDIDQFNAKSEKPMPRIVVIFDEYAAIKARRDSERSIQDIVMQLSAKGRACGIHLVICTQNPSVEIVPGPSKANMAFRVAGPMPTHAASSTILGVGDAAKLPDIKGRMLAMCGSKIWQIQTPHCLDEDKHRAIATARAYEMTEADRIDLPVAADLIAFSDDELIRIMLNDFGGATSTRAIYDVLKDSINITFSQLSEQMQGLVARGTNGNQIQHKGDYYYFERYRNGHKLIKAEMALEIKNTPKT